ncbi:MAG: class I SAM-dependent RNA methyltransferase [Terrimicrobiaceae bacterium]
MNPTRGAELPVTIESIGYGGAGIGRLPDGRVCFVHGTLPGERVLVRIVKEKKNHAEGEVVRVLEASLRRVTPKCPVYGECGGCALQHADYDLQLEIKTSQVRDLLRRFAKIQQAPVAPMIASPLQWNYRNRISVHLDRQRIGFHHRKSHHIVDIASCPLATEAVNSRLADLRAHPPRDKSRVTLREARDAVGFSQVNDGAAEFLAATVVEMAGSGKFLVDAYCGSGFFAKRLISRFDQITGLEWSQPAIAEARRDASPNETYLPGAVENSLAGVLSDAPLAETTLLLDPPAEGLSPDVARTILENPPARIVYVSCDPATFSRDTAKFLERYTLVRVQPVDMFPQTAEIELAAQFLIA